MSVAVERQPSSDPQFVGKTDRSASKSTQDSGVVTEDESALSDECEENYHFVEALKVLGVHKQEKPKAHYLFVIVVKWNDKNQVTVYRKWRELKEFQHAVLKATKSQKGHSEAHHFIKKTAYRVRKASRFRHGTIKKLDMIDSLNSFFEAVVHYSDTAHSSYVRRFFKPTESDLDSMSWSGSGRTYFYVTRDVLGEKNTGYNVDEHGDELEDETFDEGIDSSRHMNKQGTAIQQTEEEFNDALEKYNEADPNISWPIKSSLFTAICDFDASTEDRKENIIGLTKGEEIEVLEKSDTGWWLVTRTKDDPKTKNGLNECGYVPASHLQIKTQKVVTKSATEESFDDTSVRIEDDAVSSFSFHTNVSDDAVENASIESGERSDDSFKIEERPPSIRHGFLQRLERVESFGSMSSINESDWSGSPFTSMESIASSVDTPTPKPRRKKLAFIEKATERPISPLVQNRKCFTPVLGRHRMQSESLPITSSQGSMTPPMVRRAQTLDHGLGMMTGSIPDLTRHHFESPSISPASSTVSLTKKGTDYVSIKAYHAINDDELSFENGSIIKVISRNTNGWWLAKYNGKTGLVPSVNLKKYRDPIRTMMESLA